MGPKPPRQPTGGRRPECAPAATSCYWEMPCTKTCWPCLGADQERRLGMPKEPGFMGPKLIGRRFPKNLALALRKTNGATGACVILDHGSRPDGRAPRTLLRHRAGKEFLEEGVGVSQSGSSRFAIDALCNPDGCFGQDPTCFLVTPDEEGRSVEIASAGPTSSSMTAGGSDRFRAHRPLAPVPRGGSAPRTDGPSRRSSCRTPARTDSREAVRGLPSNTCRAGNGTGWTSGSTENPSRRRPSPRTAARRKMGSCRVPPATSGTKAASPAAARCSATERRASHRPLEPPGRLRARPLLFRIEGVVFVDPDIKLLAHQDTSRSQLSAGFMRSKAWTIVKSAVKYHFDGFAGTWRLSARPSRHNRSAVVMTA